MTFLCKRRYTGSDVISDRFGRLYQIPFKQAGWVIDNKGLD